MRALTPYKPRKRKKQKRGFPIEDFGNDRGGVIPEWFYPLFRHPGNLRAGVQKYLKAYGCLIKALRHDERGGFLNASTRGLNYKGDKSPL